MQESLVRAFRSLGALRQQDRFGQWLNTIVRRQAQQWSRDGKHRPEPVDAAALRGVPGLWAATPEPPTELVDRLRAALASLSQRERQAMVLHYLEGRSCEEIAARLKVSTGAVKRILYYSRRKAREECEAMMAAEQVKTGPRKLVTWISGNIEDEHESPFNRLTSSLAQTICLAANKRPKTVAELAEEVGTHPGYVEQTVEDLVRGEVLVSARKGTYLANFLAFDGEDWRRLMGLVREPAGESAKRFTAAEGRLRAAFERGPLAASGWAWADVKWAVYAVMVANMGANRALSPQHRPPWPERPGGQYWLGGYEEASGMAPVWTTGFNTHGPMPTLKWGYFWTHGLRRQYTGFGDDRKRVVEVFADGPLTEPEALGRLEGDAEHWRGVIADLVKAGFLARSDGAYRLMIPVFTQGDSDVLTPEVDAVAGPVMREVAEPVTARVDGLLDEMGYSKRREQFAQWHRWLISNIMGEALRFLMEQGMLPRPPDPAPETFGFVAWKGNLPLLSWGGHG